MLPLLMNGSETKTITKKTAIPAKVVQVSCTYYTSSTISELAFTRI